MLSVLSTLSVRSAFAAVALFALGTALSASLAGTAAEVLLRTLPPLLAATCMLAGICLGSRYSPRIAALVLIAMPLVAFGLVPFAWWVADSRPEFLWVLYVVGGLAALTALAARSRTPEVEVA